MKTKTIVIISILGLFTFWGCNNNSTGSENENSDSIIGSWEKQLDEDSTVTLSFIENNTFTALLEGGIGDIVNGAYTVSGNEITFADDDCSEEEGIYSYSFSDHQLLFILISDDCDRNGIIPGTWTKK